MKVELNIPQEFIDQIADNVMQKLLSALVANGQYKEDSILRKMSS